MRIYLAVRPEHQREAAGFPAGLACAAYRIGEDSALLSRNLLRQAPCGEAGRGGAGGGLLVLSDEAAPPIRRPEALAGAVLRECGRREYEGVVLDFEKRPTEERRRLIAALSRQCAAGRKSLFLPEACADAAERRMVMVNTAVSGGSFEEHIREVCGRYGGAQNVALDVQRLRMRFSLPARNGRGEALTQEELDALLAQKPAVFFSRDLCARYFTGAGCGSAGFVLYDDAGTLRRKVRIGRELGVVAAFFQWPEIRDLARELFRRP